MKLRKILHLSVLSLITAGVAHAQESDSKATSSAWKWKKQDGYKHEKVLDGLLTKEVQASASASGGGMVTIPMSSYQDLLNRLENVESHLGTGSTGGKYQLPSDKVVYTPERKGGLYGSYEFVYVKPVYTSAPAFFVHDTDPGVENALETSFDHDLEASHRYELGYLVPSSDLGWRVRYWSFDGDDAQRSANDVDVKISVADDPDIGIDDVNTRVNDFYDAFASTQMQVIDFEAFSLKQKGCVEQQLGVECVTPKSSTIISAFPPNFPAATLTASCNRITIFMGSDRPCRFRGVAPSGSQDSPSISGEEARFFSAMPTPATPDSPPPANRIRSGRITS